MGNILKVIGVIFLCFIVVLVILLAYLVRRPFVDKNYHKKVETGGEIERKYIRSGSYEVSYVEERVLQGFEKYEIYYPTELGSSDKKYPVVVFVNGTGVKASKYSALLEHMASWGFVVIGTEETYDWNGFSAEMCIRHLFRLNEKERINDKDNIFYGKIDANRVGITGHSQGGVGVFHAITTQKHKDVYKAAVAISPTNKELAKNLEWDYDATKIKTPILLLSGAGGGDDWVVTGEQLKSIYHDIPNRKFMMRRSNTNHGSMLYAADGYVTAWFMWHLQGDTESAKVFDGSRAELQVNSCYEDIESDWN